jgi:hypothetical protein
LPSEITMVVFSYVPSALLLRSPSPPAIANSKQVRKNDCTWAVTGV